MGEVEGVGIRWRKKGLLLISVDAADVLVVRGRGGTRATDAKASSHHASQTAEVITIEGPGGGRSEGRAGRRRGGGTGAASTQAVPTGAAGPQGVRLGGKRAAPVVVTSTWILKSEPNISKHSKN